MAFIKRKCCSVPCGLNCEDWCDCLPNGIHVTMELFQRWEVWDNGQLKDHAQLALDIRNVPMAKYQDAFDCYLYSTGTGGTWNYAYDYSNKVYPQYNFYIQPFCRGCLDLQQCYTRNMVGGGNIAQDEVYLDCHDPCNPINPAYPTNRLVFDFVAPLTVTDTNYNECEDLYGTQPPPYTIYEQQYGEFYGKRECLVPSTFSQRTLRWKNIYDGAVPQQDSYICTNINVCSGGCKGGYSCICSDPSCTPPYVPVYDYWSSYSVASCTGEVCVDTHDCWNGFFGNQPAVYDCKCDGNKSGVVKREYKHWMNHTVTITIP